MSTQATFALNHITAPGLDFGALARLAAGLGMTGIEVRNDLVRRALDAALVRAAAAAAGVAVLSVNALGRFDRWDAERAAQLSALAATAQAAGARAIVLCPTNDRADRRGSAERSDDLRRALAAIAPLLAARGLAGLVEPLGFAQSALRFKAEAVAAIDEAGAGATLSLVHDTFHHLLSGETAIFPERTGLVHVSGVEANRPAAALTDEDRILVGPADRLGNAEQLRALRRGGYAGAASFEAFSPAVHALPDIHAALAASMAALAGAAGER